MKAWTKNRIREAASSLVLVLVITAAGILLVSGVLSWMNTNSRLTERINQYDKAVGAASAATEKVISHLTRDFQIGGDSNVVSRLPVYRGIVPTADKDSGLLDSTLGVVSTLLGGSSTGAPAPKPIWTEFEFRNLAGQVNQSAVDQVTPWQYTNIRTRFPGLKGYSATYRVSSTARHLASRYNTLASVRQEVEVASVPVFSYQVFYVPDLEINPNMGMTFSGRVHCNGSIYTQAAMPVTFANAVTASRRIAHQKHPLDPSTRPSPTVSYPGGRETGVSSLSLALGTNSSLRSILEVPPASESRTSAMGVQRLYNQADLIILVSNSTGVAYSGAYNGFSVKVPWTNLVEKTVIVPSTGLPVKPGKKAKIKTKKPPPAAYTTNIVDGVVSTNVTFFDARENKTIRCVEIDIVELIDNMTYLTSLLGRPVKTLYVADMRSQTAVTQSGIRVISGETLPSGGLTIATPNPLYILGDYNVLPANQGTTNTTGSVPAALMGDAITVLSDQWDDAYSTSNLTSRVATNITLNAALIGGIVPSDGNYYSGGVENFPRVLENWTGYTFTLNGSMVALFQSAIATAPWGARPGVYNTPTTRKWNFDPRLSTLSGLPPSTPQVRTVIRRKPEIVPST